MDALNAINGLLAEGGLLPTFTPPREAPAAVAF
jgi:hypothetical protein